MILEFIVMSVITVVRHAAEVQNIINVLHVIVIESLRKKKEFVNVKMDILIK
jgi:hypothetical protein